jgi:hypothetical protein
MRYSASDKALGELLEESLPGKLLGNKLPGKSLD